MKDNMDIQGLDYNTTRAKLVLPEYGREIQKMVEHALTIENRAERQLCAETIIATMRRMFPQDSKSEERDHKFWDHLAIMSDFKLDIDYPYDIEKAHAISAKPEQVPLPQGNIPVRHYGRMMFELFDKLKTMPAGEERDALVVVTANQMKRSLMQWSHGSCDDEKVADDLARYTDGIIQLDLESFNFENVAPQQDRKKKKR